MINMTEYGYPDPPDCKTGDSILPARITAAHRDLYEVVCPHGETTARLKSGIYFRDLSEELFPAVGDFVRIQHNPLGVSLIVQTLARRTKFSRNDFSGHAAAYVKTVLEQVVAANFDYVFILVSLNQDVNVKRLERYLALAWQSKAEPVVLLTKSDLAADAAGQILAAQKVAAGAPVFAISVKTGSGIRQLDACLQPGKTIVFLGASGVGKSSLVNALAGETIMKTGEIRADDGRGRHTTTCKQLIRLSGGAMLIDTPGMRELGLWDADAGIDDAFDDVLDFLGQCRFANCSHAGEPGCAITTALANGKLAPERWQNYLQLKRELVFVGNNSAKGPPVRRAAGKRPDLYGAAWQGDDD